MHVHKWGKKCELGNIFVFSALNLWSKLQSTGSLINIIMTNKLKDFKVYMTDFFICSIKSPQCTDKYSTKNV